ncbi:hypothetical protein ACMV5I_28605 [Serratia sp. T13T92]|uniref:hypothetical protein n=1 Tax=Serratia sp. T13T92 TaxID=3397496 RepID=UPI0039E13941
MNMLLYLLEKYGFVNAGVITPNVGATDEPEISLAYDLLDTGNTFFAAAVARDVFAGAVDGENVRE